MKQSDQNKGPSPKVTAVDPSQEHLRRKCSACGNAMSPTEQGNEAWNGPGADRGLRYGCQNCDTNVLIGDGSSIAASMFSGIGVFIILIYALLNGLTEFITYALFTEATLPSILLGAGTAALLVVFLLGSIFLLIGAFQKILTRHQYPLLTKGSAYSQIWKALIIGLIPCLIILGIGYLNYTFLDDNEAVLLVIFPVLFAPLYFAPKFGLSWMSVFMAMVFWAALGVGMISILG